MFQELPHIIMLPKRENITGYTLPAIAIDFSRFARRRGVQAQNHETIVWLVRALVNPKSRWKGLPSRVACWPLEPSSASASTPHFSSLRTQKMKFQLDFASNWRAETTTGSKRMSLAYKSSRSRKDAKFALAGRQG